jgi:hypothetical protein
MGTGSFPGVKRPGRGVDHPPQSSAEVKERGELYLYSPSGPSWTVLGRTLLLRSMSVGPAYPTWFRGFTQSHGRFLLRHHWHLVCWFTCRSWCQGASVFIVCYCFGFHFVVCAFVFTSVESKSWMTATSPSKCLTQWSLLLVCLVFRGNCLDPGWRKLRNEELIGLVICIPRQITL